MRTAVGTVEQVAAIAQALHEQGRLLQCSHPRRLSDEQVSIVLTFRAHAPAPVLTRRRVLIGLLIAVLIAAMSSALYLGSKTVDAMSAMSIPRGAGGLLILALILSGLARCRPNHRATCPGLHCAGCKGRH